MSSFLGSETKYFYSLTPDVIDNALLFLGIKPSGRTLALNSLENRVYNVEVQTKMLEEFNEMFVGAYSMDQVVIKFYRPGRWSKDAILEEHQSLKQLFNLDLPVVPALSVDNETLFQEKTTGLFYAVFPKVLGRLKDEFQENEVAQLGRLLARVHRGLDFLAPYKSRGSLNPKGVLEESCDVIQGFQPIPSQLKESFLHLARQLALSLDVNLQHLKSQRIHGDVHRGNLIWNHHGPFLMDFDDSIQGPVEQDLWLLVPGDEELDQKLNLKFLNSYNEFAGTNVYLSKQVKESLRSLRIIRYVAWITKRYEDPFFIKMFPHFLSHGFWEQQVLTLKEQLAALLDNY